MYIRELDRSGSPGTVVPDSNRVAYNPTYRHWVHTVTLGHRNVGTAARWSCRCRGGRSGRCRGGGGDGGRRGGRDGGGRRGGRDGGRCRGRDGSRRGSRHADDRVVYLELVSRRAEAAFDPDAYPARCEVRVRSAPRENAVDVELEARASGHHPKHVPRVSLVDGGRGRPAFEHGRIAVNREPPVLVDLETIAL